MAGEADGEASKPEHLRVVERVFAGLIGLAILISAGALIIEPPSHKEVIDGCMDTTAANCVQEVSSIPEAVTSTLVGAGVILILLALLGIRFTSIKAAGVELGVAAAPSSKDDAEGAKDQGKVTPLIPQTFADQFAEGGEAPVEGQLKAWGLLPADIQQAGVRRWRVDGKSGHPSTAISQVYAPLQDNQDWYIEFLDGTVYRITPLAS